MAELTKEKIEKLMSIKGQVRWSGIKNDLRYVVYLKGEEGYKKLAKEMERIGYPIEHKETRTLEFSPVGLEAVVLLKIKELFNLTDDDFRKMGSFNPKDSLIIKTFSKYFISLKLIASQAPKLWQKYYTIGKLQMEELNEKEKYAILTLKDFALDQVQCRTLEGFFASVTQMAVKDKVTCNETKCVFQNDQYHEFLLEW